MLLRRIANALKRQDWATVFIEFALVVAGVLFALQVNSWAGEAAERQREKAALERLFLEAQNAYRTTSATTERAQRLNQLRRDAIALIDSDAPLPENTLPTKIGINTLAQFPRLSVIRVVYDELKSSGQMSLLQSPKVRDAVSSFHTDTEGFNGLQEGFGDSTNDFWVQYRQHIYWRHNPESTTSDIILSTYDWESLRQDKEFITISLGLMRNHLVAESFLIDINDQARTMCEELAAAVGKPCATGSDTDPASQIEDAP